MMSMKLLIVLLFINYSNSLFTWKLRTLKCELSDCYLLSTEKDGFNPAKCVQEENRHICDIECDGADRDSVISKNPTDFRLCSRFFTYNTEKTEDSKWYIWRNGNCAKSNITFSVHCAFPFTD